MAHISMGWRLRGGILAAVGFSMAGGTLAAAKNEVPDLGAARSFAVLGAETVTSTGLTAITGDVGVSPGTEITGFPPATVTEGEIHAGDTAASAAHADAAIAYLFLEGMPSVPANNLSDVDLGGLTLEPGVYRFNTSAQLTGDLVLDARGHSDALFVFQIGSTLTTGTGATVTVINGGRDYDESNVFWQIGSSATLGVNTAFTGNVLAYSSITIVSGSSLYGSALAINGAVTMDSNAVTSPPLAGVHGTGKDDSSKDGTILPPPSGAPETKAFARLDVKHFSENHSRQERSWFRAKMRHLEASTGYTLWADDPSTEATDLVQFDSFTTGKSGNFNYTKDTRRGDALPFGATVADLSGMAIELRDSAGTTTLLAGTIPIISR